MRTFRTNQKKKKKNTGSYAYTSRMKRLIQHNEKMKPVLKKYKIKM